MTRPAHSEKNKSPAAASSVIDELVEVVAHGDVNQRLRILQRVTDLFVIGGRHYSRDQVALFDDVLQELAADIEVKARAKLAHKLAGLSYAPPKLIRTLAFDDAIEVAGPVLVRSEQLTDDDLVANARTKSQKHLLAIAQRLKLSEAVTDVLVTRGDSRVVRKVAGNRGARFSLAGYDRLTFRAQRDRKLTLTLGHRSDLPRQHFIKLLETASASVRAKLEAANPQAAAAIRDTIDDVACAMQREAREASQEFNVAARDARLRFRVHPVAEVNVHAPARAQEFDKVVVALAKLGGFSIDLVERALLDEGKEMLLVLARAAGCSWTTTRELLQMQAVGRKLNDEEIGLSFERFKKLSEETARKVVLFRERRIKMRTSGLQKNGKGARRGSATVVSLKPKKPKKPEKPELTPA